MKKIRFPLAAALTLFLFSCATSVPVQVTKPPVIDMSGVERIAVVPIGFAYERAGVSHFDALFFRFSRKYRYKSFLEDQIARFLTAFFTDAVLASGNYFLINTAEFDRVYSWEDAYGYAAIVDVYLTGEINELRVDDREGYVDRKDSEGNIVSDYTINRTVTLDFTYRFIRAADGRVLGQVHKSGTACDRREGEWARQSITSGMELAKTIIRDQLQYISRELAPWTVTEYRYFESDKTKDPFMKEAEKLVKDRQYAAALGLYSDIYAATGNFAAGYNAAILTELIRDINDAIGMMQDLAYVTGNPKAASEVIRMQRTLADSEVLREKY
ncbi:MAG: hypothetical protein LBU99_01045 [Spirochaetaceae bacterium]|jgi:hypothetical protein|nr:hypothetical protein [Spirochaetaceae bacterium]